MYAVRERGHGLGGASRRSRGVAHDDGWRPPTERSGVEARFNVDARVQDFRTRVQKDLERVEAFLKSVVLCKKLNNARW